MIVLLILLWLVLTYVMLTFFTWIIQWGLEGILSAVNVDASMPFWPIFWILFVFAALGSSHRISSS